jgi:drug/metabolite transporter (DMT)-like permease
MNSVDSNVNAKKGLLLGALGVLIFSLTLPMTKIAMEGGALSAWFAWAGRCVLGALAGIAFLLLYRRGRTIPSGQTARVTARVALPPRAAWWPIAGATFGIVFGWPLMNTIALQYTQASHAAVVNGILPLATAIIGAWLNREKLSKRFWMCAALGSAVVCSYAWYRGGGEFTRVDLLLLLGVVLGGFGYACGAIATKYQSGPEVISWALILGLPITNAIAFYSMPHDPTSVTTKSWLAFVYLGLMSQWIGFFFWYRGLAIGGIAKVSQVQLIQLFCTLTFSAMLLGESIELAMVLVALTTVSIVAIGRRK